MTLLVRSARSVRTGGVFTALALLWGLLAADARATVQPTGSMAARRSEHAATFLGTGKVRVAGGAGSTGRLATAELHDPATDAFTVTAPMSEARTSFTLMRIPGGLVVAAGGRKASVLSSAERYNVPAGTWRSAGALVAGGFVGKSTTIEPTVETLGLWPGLADSSRPVMTS